MALVVHAWRYTVPQCLAQDESRGGKLAWRQHTDPIIQLTIAHSPSNEGNVRLLGKWVKHGNEWPRCKNTACTLTRYSKPQFQSNVFLRIHITPFFFTNWPLCDCKTYAAGLCFRLRPAHLLQYLLYLRLTGRGVLNNWDSTHYTVKSPRSCFRDPCLKRIITQMWNNAETCATRKNKKWRKQRLNIENGEGPI